MHRRGRNKYRMCREAPEALEVCRGGDEGQRARRHQLDELHRGLGVDDVREVAGGGKLLVFGIRRALKKSGKPLILQRSHSGEWRKIQKDLVTIFRSWSPSGTRRVSGNCKRNGSNGRNWHRRVSGCLGHRIWSNGRNLHKRVSRDSFLGHGDFRAHICSSSRDEIGGVGWNG